MWSSKVLEGFLWELNNNSLIKLLKVWFFKWKKKGKTSQNEAAREFRNDCLHYPNGFLFNGDSNSQVCWAFAAFWIISFQNSILGYDKLDDAT